MDRTGTPVKVVAGIITRGERVLIAKRRDEGYHGGLWEFPGGKVEEGETPAAALVRDLDEELGITVRAGEVALGTIYHYPHFTIDLLAIPCEIVEGEPKPLDAKELKWVVKKSLGDYPMPEADKPIVEWLRGGESG